MCIRDRVHGERHAPSGNDRFAFAVFINVAAVLDEGGPATASDRERPVLTAMVEVRVLRFLKDAVPPRRKPRWHQQRHAVDLGSWLPLVRVHLRRAAHVVHGAVSYTHLRAHETDSYL